MVINTSKLSVNSTLIEYKSSTYKCVSYRGQETHFVSVAFESSRKTTAGHVDQRPPMVGQSSSARYFGETTLRQVQYSLRRNNQKNIKENTSRKWERIYDFYVFVPTNKNVLGSCIEGDSRIAGSREDCVLYERSQQEYTWWIFIEWIRTGKGPIEWWPDGQVRAPAG